MLRRILLIPMVALLIAAAGPNDDAAKSDLRTFQGTWVLVSAEKDGKKLPDDKGIKLLIAESRYMLTQTSAAVIG